MIRATFESVPLIRVFDSLDPSLELEYVDHILYRKESSFNELLADVRKVERALSKNLTKKLFFFAFPNFFSSEQQLEHRPTSLLLFRRHEVPVSIERIKIIHIDDDLVVVNKPASIPVSARFNGAI